MEKVLRHQSNEHARRSVAWYFLATLLEAAQPGSSLGTAYFENMTIIGKKRINDTPHLLQASPSEMLRLTPVAIFLGVTTALAAVIIGLASFRVCGKCRAAMKDRHMTIDEQGFLSPEIVPWIDKHRGENRAWFSHAMNLNSVAQQLWLAVPAQQSLQEAPS